MRTQIHMMRGTDERDEQAVTVIVGTLMLILVTVIAAAGLAVMVSQMQKDEMNRQSHQAAVKNELLKITAIHPSYQASTGMLEELNVTILNLNIGDSKINLVGLGDRTFPRNFSSGGILYNNTYAGLLIPAARQAEITLNIANNFDADPGISRTDALRVFMISSYYNTFETTFKPPIADFTLNIESEDLGVAERDVIILDGSSSGDDGTIVEWNWSVFENGVSLSHVSGKTARFVPVSTGPFDVYLTVTDDTNMQGITGNKTIPGNPRFSPATHMDYSVNLSTITVFVSDINNIGVMNEVVTFVRYSGNVSLSKNMAITDSSGNANVTVNSGVGILKIESGKLPAAYVEIL
jgi:hypothetical protein